MTATMDHYSLDTHPLHASHFLVPHAWAAEMAIALARVRPNAPPFQFGVAVKEVVEDLLREREHSRVLEEDLTDATRQASRMRLRLRTRVADRIVPVCEGNTTTWQCEACGMSAASLSDIRHVDGTEIGTRPCEVLLDLVALGVEPNGKTTAVEALTCANCRHYGGGSPEGLCNRPDPPEITDGGLRWALGWPTVMASDCCGHHERGEVRADG